MTKKLKYQINKEGSAKWTIEKELSDFGLICGLQRKIYVYPIERFLDSIIRKP